MHATPEDRHARIRLFLCAPRERAIDLERGKRIKRMRARTKRIVTDDRARVRQQNFATGEREELPWRNRAVSVTDREGLHRLAFNRVRRCSMAVTNRGHERGESLGWRTVIESMVLTQFA